MVKVLVLGFSVTAEGPGFVESARQNLGKDDEFSLTKIGIGGVHPTHLKFLIKDILQDMCPDFVVLEISTSGFRMFHKNSERHQETINWILYTCQQQGVGLAVLDLPRKDVDQETDWVAAMHRQTCLEHNIPYHLVPLRPEFINDGVHPDPTGRAYYADHLLTLLRGGDLKAPILTAPPVKTEFGVYNCIPVIPEDSVTHERGGYALDVAVISPEKPLSISLEPGTDVVGLLFLMGPRTGKIGLQVGDTLARVSAYDEFCYYERVGVQIFPALKGDTVTFTQLPEIPDVVLRKGDKDLSTRLGYVGKILYERPL